MPRSKPSEKDLKEREKRAEVWKQFMSNHLFTEKRLAETLGISRRTVQMVKAAAVSPHKDTLGLFESLRAKYDREKKRK